MKGLGAVLIACILVVGHVNAAQGASSPSGSSNWASVSYSSLPSAVKAAALKKVRSRTSIQLISCRC